MSTGVILAGFDPSVLLGYYQAKLPVAPSTLSATAAAQAKNKATANDSPPWEATHPSTEQHDAEILGTTDFLDTSKVPLTTGNTADGKIEQDNQKLFALYTAVNNLSYLAGMSKRDGMTAGQLAGFNVRFQAGLQQIRDFISKTSFNNFTLQAATPSSSAVSDAGVSFGSYTYKTRTLATDTNLDKAIAGLSKAQSFTISVRKGGVNTDVQIDLSKIGGTLSLDNVISYVNQQLSAAGFASRLHRTITKGTIDDPKNASYGMEVAPSGTETLSFSSPSAMPALYIAGNSGLANATGDAEADQQGRLIKLGDLPTPSRAYSARHPTRPRGLPPRSPPSWTRAETSMSWEMRPGISATSSIRATRTSISRSTTPPETFSGPACSAAPARPRPMRWRSIPPAAWWWLDPQPAR
jgi:hypothetical protein